MTVSRRQLQQAMESLEPDVLAAFREMMREAADQINIGELTAAIEARDIGRAVQLASMDTATLAVMTEALRQAYVRAGQFHVANLPKRRGGGRFVIAFDARNPRAEAHLARESSRFVTAIVNEQREAIRIAVTAGAEVGQNPRRTALDIVGRISRQTGRREGGIVGLTGQQAGYVTNMRAELSDPERMGRYFTRTRRDRRFDGAVRKAMDAGKPLPAAKIDQLAGRYADRLLQLRGETIARTETLSAFNTANYESLQQLTDRGVPREAIKRTWVTSRDGRERDSHAEADGQQVGLDEPFQVGGVMMMHPGEMGAPAEEVINCRCTVRTEVDYVAVELAEREAA
jgi:hypothetical protein